MRSRIRDGINFQLASIANPLKLIRLCAAPRTDFRALEKALVEHFSVIGETPLDDNT
jgi:hypothetical protein